MPELEISIMDTNSGVDPEKELRAVLGDFQAQYGSQMTCVVYDWATAWAEVMKIILYKHGPAVSQVGTTWLGSLEATQALRPFTPAEIGQLGGANAYHPAAWKSGIFAETGRLTALPWFMDTYVLYYRKDLLRKAGVDEAKAFESLDSLAETVQRLAQAGVSIPFSMPTGGVATRAHIHNIAGWVWNYGGEFISEDGKHLLLSDAKTRQGLKAYFLLSKHTPKAAQTLSDLDCYRVFLDGNAAITLRNTSLIYAAQHDPVFAPYLANMGIAAMPGENFVGGSCFVLWNHTHHVEERLAMELLRQVTLPETQFAYFKQNGFLPTRVEALKMLEAEPFFAPVVEALARGRSFRKIKLWGLIEERLMVGIQQIWQTLYANENANIEEEIARVLDPLERRLQLTLSDG
jgi:multiple sugar transport system substrate-binding protein